jgi:hypothetical protein
MISVIHPSSSHFPGMGPAGVSGARVPFAHPGHPGHPGLHTGFAVNTTSTGSNPAMTNYGHQLIMAAKAGEQISEAYRRQDSGYTHHVSNSQYHHIPPAAQHQVPQVQQQTQQQSLQRSSSSRSLSSFLRSSSSASPSTSKPVVSPSSSLSKSKTYASYASKSKPRGLVFPPAGKDLSSTLFVDCSIEYELPNAPKIPKNSAPILMMVPSGFKQPQRPSAPSRVVQQPAKPVAVPAVATAPASIAKCNGHRGGAQCQCTASNASNATPAIVKDGRGLKRSYATAMSNDFYKHLNQPQPHPNQSAAHAYFDNTSNTSTSALEAYAAAKRTRLQMAENQKIFNHQQQLFQQQQQHQAQMLRHYQQTYYSRQHQQQQQQTTQQQITTQEQIKQEQIKQQQRDLRISSFQQITPPESLAFWQQQQQLTAQNMSCRSACCTTQVSTVTTTALDQRYVNKYSPPCPYAPVCCYTLPPTPMVDTRATANPSCMGCAQGKCQQVAVANAKAVASTRKI